MKKVITKVKNKVKMDKNLIIFLFILLIIGIIAGSIFASILNESDKILVSNHLNTFITDIENNKVEYFNSFKNNLFSILFNNILIWLLGISVIGLPIVIIMYFSNSFILGFTIGSILSTFKLKGCLFALIYVFPSEVLNLLILMILVMYSISFSLKLIHSIFKKKTIDFKIVMNRYFRILLFVVIFNIITTLYSTYIMPILLKTVITFIR